MPGHYFRLITVVITSLGFLTASGIAQESAGGSPAGYSQVVSANPFGMILLPWYNGEYERTITESITLGLSGSRLPWGDGSGFYSVGAALRYYPNSGAFRGFFLGPRIGMYWVTQDQNGEIEDDPWTQGQQRVEEDATGLGIGFELGNAWLLGSERHLSISIGFGATRVLNGMTIPVLRLVNVGWAF